MPTFQLERTADFKLEAFPELLTAHWRELGLDQDLKGDPNFEQMEKLEAVGLWHTLTARDNGKLVGYLWALLSPHLHYKSSKPMLIVDAYYVIPEYRKGTGVQLLKFMEAFAKQKEAIKIYLSCKVHRDHSKLFLMLGYRLSDYAFVKRI